MSCDMHGEEGNAGYWQRQTSVIDNDKRRANVLVVRHVFPQPAVTSPVDRLGMQYKRPDSTRQTKDPDQQLCLGDDGSQTQFPRATARDE